MANEINTMSLMEALRIVLNLAECNQITREEAESEGPDMWQTYLDQNTALNMVNDVIEGHDSHGSLIPD